MRERELEGGVPLRVKFLQTWCCSGDLRSSGADSGVLLGRHKRLDTSSTADAISYWASCFIDELEVMHRAGCGIRHGSFLNHRRVHKYSYGIMGK